MEQVEKDRIQKEQEELEKNAIKATPLKEVIDKIDWTLDKEPLMILPSTQVLIVAYDPFTRNLSVKHVKSVNGLTDCINILRDSVYQLEQMELVRKTIMNVAGIIQNECAKLFANLTGNKRQ